MRILSIETSCDETAVSIVEAVGTFPQARYTVLGNSLFSQIDIHREYGGVFPMVAKREHARTLVPMLMRALGEAKLLVPADETLVEEHHEALYTLLAREEGLADSLIHFLEQYEKPPVDLIAVTNGPGLEPTLWVGINFARALSKAWDIPVAPINHMEGHILSSIFDGETIPEIVFPAVSLLISGGHTELILMREWGHYEKIGETRDDAVGEAFDKVARMLSLPYPGGPEIGNLALVAREKKLPSFVQLPRPMLESGDFDFSFSGLKTAVRYAVQNKTLTHGEKASVAREFEDAVATVLLRKTKNAIDRHNAQTLIVGGGVSANTYIRETFKEYFWKEYPMVTVYLPPRNLSTDNSIMIALAGHAKKDTALTHNAVMGIVADGNLELTP
jgi:N6-L-threonylcarbamoyladenine synthase